MKTFPLLQSQMGVVLACSKHPHSTCYNLPGAIPYPCEIDAGRLVAAIEKVIDARPALKIRLVKDEQGRVRQYVDAAMSIPILMRTATEDELERYLRHGFVRPFDLFEGEPLCRFEVIVTGEHCWLLWDFHHVIADGITIAHHFIGRDLPSAYSCQECRDVTSECLLRLFLQAEAEEDSFGGTSYQQARAYYLTTFESIEMTTMGAQTSSPAHASISTYLKRAAVDSWCKSHHARPHAFLMTVFNIVLSKFCHSRHLAYATLFHGRADRRLRDAYGMFVKTVPVACEVNPSNRVENAVEEIQRCLFSAIRHSVYPFTHFCHDMQTAPGITFAFQGENILEQVFLDGHSAKGIQLERDAMDGELSCVVYCQTDEYEIRTEAVYDECNPHWAFLVAQSMKNAVEYILVHPDARIGDVDIVSEEEKNALLSLSQGERMAVDDSDTWVDDFLKQVKSSPDAIAVCDGTTSLTYSILEERSRKVAAYLKSDLVGSGDLVGVEAIPCTNFLVAAIGVMRSGAAYVPIDPQWPAQHQQTIIEEARLKKMIGMDTLSNLDTLDTLDILDTLDGQSPAYVIFTSGSTGRPKGVVIPHRALHNFAHFIVQHWRLTASSRISCHSSLAFDGSVEDLFPVLTVGGTVYIMPEEVRRDPDALHRFIDQYQITGGCYTTAMAPLLAARPHSSLDYICFGGEKLLHRPDMSCHVYNTYGPTEFTVDATYHELSEKDGPDIPIGRPLSNCAAYITDQYGMLLPREAVGELCLQGPQMALGYLHDPELTAMKFTECPFIDGKVYHTGDLVRWDEHGRLHYVGRCDRQVKVNGFRISIDEVEQRIASLKYIQQVAVNIQKMGGHEALCAFFTADREIPSEQMRMELHDRCPAYMIPSAFVQMEHLPQTASGKVDYKRLHLSNHSLVIQEKKASHYPLPVNEQERLLCQIFAKVLDVEDVGVTDDFFQLGGTSITAMQVLMEAEKADLHIQYGDVFRYPTPQLLAQKINDATLSENNALADYDYVPLHDFLNNLNIPSTPNNPSTPSIPNTPRKILLTGATGYLGAHVLRELIKSDDTICCVVRALSETEALERLDDTWQYYFGQSLGASSPVSTSGNGGSNRIEVLPGDLTDDRFWQSLEDRDIDLVIHCAADVRHFAQQDTLIKINTQAVCRLADYCLAHHARLVHVSTLSVAGFSSTGKQNTLTDKELYVGQQFHEQYSLSKFLAERALLERMAFQGLDALIVRIGNLTARLSDGRFQRHPERNAFAMALQTMAEQNVMPQSAVELVVDVSPVDVVARELTDLVKGNTSVGIVHLAHPYQGGLPALLQRMTGRL